MTAPSAEPVIRTQAEATVWSMVYSTIIGRAPTSARPRPEVSEAADAADAAVVAYRERVDRHRDAQYTRAAERAE